MSSLNLNQQNKSISEKKDLEQISILTDEAN